MSNTLANVPLRFQISLWAGTWAPDSNNSEFSYQVVHILLLYLKHMAAEMGVVGTLNRTWTGRYRFRISARARNFLFFQNVRAESGAHPVGTGVLSPG